MGKPPAASRKSIAWLNGLAAVADQAWLSLLNFAVSLAFIRGATKAEYGSYLLLFSLLLLFLSIQNALINSPLITLLPRAKGRAQIGIRRFVIRMHILLAGASAVVGTVGLSVYSYFTNLETTIFLIAGFAYAIVGSLAREAQRSIAYVDGKGIHALRGDIIYGLVLLTGVALAFIEASLYASTVLFLTGIAGTAPIIFRARGRTSNEYDASTLQDFWNCGKWALPAVFATWLSLSAYPYFAERSLGLLAVAEIGAARLFVMPVGTITAAWSNWFRPRVSKWAIDGDIEHVKSLTRKSLILGLTALAALAVILYFLYPLVEPFLGEQYANLLPLILLWLLFFGLSFARSVLMATVMARVEGYKIFHHITWGALAFSIGGFLVVGAMGAVWIVGVMCCVEALQTILVGTYAIKSWEHQKSINNVSQIVQTETLKTETQYVPGESITVAICTYRRPDTLRIALESLWRQKGTLPTSIKVLVVDNDPLGTAEPVVKSQTPPVDWTLEYFNEKNAGVSSARNACLVRCDTELIAFIDDDETPESNWLSDLNRTRKATRADAVFGPVISKFCHPPSKWHLGCRAYQRPRHQDGVLIHWHQTRTGNVLMKAEIFAGNKLRFDPRFGETGGEDILFFANAAKAGARFAWCDSACVMEDVQKERMTLQWVLKRSFHGAENWVRVLAEFHSWMWLPMALRGLLTIALATVVLPIAIVVSRSLSVYVLQRIASGAGFVTAWFTSQRVLRSTSKHYHG